VNPAFSLGHPEGVTASETTDRRAGTQLQRADGGDLRVMVVDDEESLSELLARVLRYEGWQVETAGTGADAISLARSFRPDAVVLDVMLPDIDGFQVLAGAPR